MPKRLLERNAFVAILVTSYPPNFEGMVTVPEDGDTLVTRAFPLTIE